MNKKDEVVEHLHMLYEAWMTAIARQDIESILALYDEDAVYMPPGKPKAVGKEAIRQAWAGHLARPGFKATYTPSLTVAHALDIAYDIGAYAINLERDGMPQTFIGKYVVVWARRQEKWMIKVDMDNADA